MWALRCAQLTGLSNGIAQLVDEGEPCSAALLDYTSGQGEPLNVYLEVLPGRRGKYKGRARKMRILLRWDELLALAASKEAAKVWNALAKRVADTNRDDGRGACVALLKPLLTPIQQL